MRARARESRAEARRPLSPRKVVHVLRKFQPAEWGGIETHLVGLLPELTRLGWECEVHAPAEEGTDGSPLTAVGATFKTFRARYPYLGLTRERRRSLVAAGGNLVAIGELARLAADRRAAIFHVHTMGRLGGVVRTAARLSRRPFAVTVHGPVLSNAAVVEAASRQRTRGLLDLGAPFGWAVGARQVMRDADLMFTLNRGEHAAWQPFRNGRHLELVAHGVDPRRAGHEERLRARSAIPGLGDAPFAVVVARIDRGKGQDVAIDALARAAIPGLHLVLAGASTDAVFSTEVRRKAAAAGTHVHLIGGVHPQVARALLAEAAIALVPSRAEPFGIVLLEAWAEGTAALFADVDGLADIARETSATAWAVSGHTPERWAERLRATLSDVCGLEHERRLGPERVGRSYSWRSLAERTAQAYRKAGYAPAGDTPSRRAW